MPVIYVNEYLPSSATLRLGGDPIYRASSQVRQVQVVSPASTVLTVLGLAGVGALILWLASRGTKG